MSALIELPWPSSALSANARVHWRRKSAATKIHRTWAYLASTPFRRGIAKGSGDIPISVTFYPPSKSHDRSNMPHLAKAYLDGIADALKTNDRRFLPTYHFAEPTKTPCVVIAIEPQARAG